jgi:hypothetical protein
MRARLSYTEPHPWDRWNDTDPETGNVRQTLVDVCEHETRSILAVTEPDHHHTLKASLWDLAHGRAEDARGALVVALSQALWLSDTVGLETVLALRQSAPWEVK